MARTRWVFVRHGESVANVEGWLAGHVDTPLTEKGVRQARGAARTLADQPFSRAFCSDLQRAHRTAELILEGRPDPQEVPLTVTPQLRERALGAWSERPKAEIRRSGEMDLLLTWAERPPGGESQADLAARLLDFLADLEPVDGHTLVVAHGGVIRVMLGLLDGTPVEGIGTTRIENARPIARDIEAGRWEALARALPSPP
ncbi:MAG: histidine phosphatase family protein [Alphaproteobacteria bacterium]|nr:histidine phosphatase family protein [Alphaproteobacteria bacterium]